MYAPLLSEFIAFLAFTPLLLPLCLSNSAVHSGRCLTLVAWKTYGTLGLCPLPSIFSSNWALFGCRPSPSYLAHLLSHVRGLIGWGSCHVIALLLLYHYLSFISLLPMGLQVDVSAVPVHFPHPYLFWALLANIPAMSAHFPHSCLFWALRAIIPTILGHFIPWASLAHLLLLYFFHLHGLC